MTDPTHDLSKLKIRRDEPSPSARRALKLVAWLAGLAVVAGNKPPGCVDFVIDAV